MNRTLSLKLGAIALLIVLLLIPLLMIGGLIQDRQAQRDSVLEDIAHSSSYSQQISGPVLVVPYRKVSAAGKAWTATPSSRPARWPGTCTSCPRPWRSTQRSLPSCARAASTRPACSTPTTASAASSSCPSAGASPRTSRTTASSRRFWRWVSATSAASRRTWS
ncbi:hypothetical protein G3436_03530 [Pseudomonas sp. MAFF212427]|uniref:Cell envelope integrity protein CreD n=1 Tax=Pseudomonas brassicae TaxID=2708063 RepID=A0A6B3NS91_9PSED|nr:hypothetical protein [Pseudomonas brassicae]